MSFDPSTLPGLQIWLDASRLGLLDGAPVTSFTDYSGNGKHGYLYGQALTLPVMRAGANGLNGLPVVRTTFNQARFGWFGTGVDKEYTLVYVARLWDNSASGAQRVITANGDYANFLIGYWGGFQDCMFCNPNWIVPNGVAPTSPAATTAWKLYSADGTQAGQAGANFIPRLFSNGTLVGGGAATATSGWAGTMEVSGSSITTTAESSSCEIAELLLFRRKLSDIDRQRVESYLRSKWLTTTAPTQPVVNLQDVFATTLDRTKWAGSTAAPSTYWDASNRGVGIVTASTPNVLRTATAPLGFNLLNSSVYAKCTPSTPVAGSEFIFSLQDATPSNRIAFSVTGTNLRAWTLPAQAGGDVASVAYNATNHQWLRIRADSTYIYWETSADGVGWTLFGRVPFVPSFSTDAWCVNFSQSGTAGQPDAFVDNVNMPAVNRQWGYLGFGSDSYGGPSSLWEPLQGPAGPPGDPDMALKRLVTAPLIYNSGWSPYFQYGLPVVTRDRQGVCTLSASLSGPTGYAAGATCAFLPIGFIPMNRVMLPCLTVTTGQTFICSRLDINTDGSLQVNSTTQANSLGVHLDLMWYTAVPQLAVLDGLQVTAITQIDVGVYNVSWNPGHLIDTNGVIIPVAGASQGWQVSGPNSTSNWGYVTIGATGFPVGGGGTSTTEAAAAALYYNNCLTTAAGQALLCTFRFAAPQIINDRRWLAYA